MVWGAIASAVAGTVANKIFGGGDKSEQQAADNYLQQKEFAQNGIRWRVEDAKAAGVHPVYALGASPLNFSPSLVGGSSSPAPDYAGMGQDIGRAMMAKSTTLERLQERLLSAQVTGQEIENAAKASAVARSTDPTQVPPAMPDHIMSGGAANSSFRFSKNNNVIGASPDFANAIEDGPAQWYYQMTRTIPSMFNADTESIRNGVSDYFRKMMSRDYWREQSDSGRLNPRNRNFYK